MGIKVFFKNNTANEEINYRSMTMHGCDNLCPLDKFMELTEDLVIHDFKAECKLKEVNTNPILNVFSDVESKRFYMNMSILLVGLGLITVVLIMVAIFKKSHVKRYSHLEEEGRLMGLDQES